MSGKSRKSAMENEPLRFEKEGMLFKGKLIGSESVTHARGDKMCAEAMNRLKAVVKASGEHKQRITLTVSFEGITVFDEKTHEMLCHHPVHRISFIAQDQTDPRAFGYVSGTPQGGHSFIAIKTEKMATQIVIALRDLFRLVLEMRQHEMRVRNDLSSQPSTSRNFDGSLKGDIGSSSMTLSGQTGSADVDDMFGIQHILSSQETEYIPEVVGIPSDSSASAPLENLQAAADGKKYFQPNQVRLPPDPKTKAVALIPPPKPAGSLPPTPKNSALLQRALSKSRPDFYIKGDDSSQDSDAASEMICSSSFGDIHDPRTSLGNQSPDTLSHKGRGTSSRNSPIRPQSAAHEILTLPPPPRKRQQYRVEGKRPESTTSEAQNKDNQDVTRSPISPPTILHQRDEAIKPRIPIVAPIPQKVQVERCESEASGTSASRWEKAGFSELFESSRPNTGKIGRVQIAPISPLFRNLEHSSDLSSHASPILLPLETVKAKPPPIEAAPDVETSVLNHFFNVSQDTTARWSDFESNKELPPVPSSGNPQKTCEAAPPAGLFESPVVETRSMDRYAAFSEIENLSSFETKEDWCMNKSDDGPAGISESFEASFQEPVQAPLTPKEVTFESGFTEDFCHNSQEEDSAEPKFEATPEVFTVNDVSCKSIESSPSEDFATPPFGNVYASADSLRATFPASDFSVATNNFISAASSLSSDRFESITSAANGSCSPSPLSSPSTSTSCKCDLSHEVHEDANILAAPTYPDTMGLRRSQPGTERPPLRHSSSFKSHSNGVKSTVSFESPVKDLKGGARGSFLTEDLQQKFENHDPTTSSEPIVAEPSKDSEEIDTGIFKKNHRPFDDDFFNMLNSIPAVYSGLKDQEEIPW